MPRKYEKKTKGNFRSGRRGSRRASMRLSMVPPGFSMFDEEYDPTTDDTMLFLQAKGADRERERFGEALGVVRDRIARVGGGRNVYTNFVKQRHASTEHWTKRSGKKLGHHVLFIYEITCSLVI